MARGHFYPLPPPFIGGRQPYAPQLGLPQSGAAAPVGPPPVSNANQAIIVRAYRDTQWTLIYVTSIAPLLSAPVAPDAPPPRSYATMNSIVRQWDRVPNRPPPLRGIGQFSIVLPPDPPPRRSYAAFVNVRARWEPPVWWPLPKINNAAPPSGVDPPPGSGTAIYMLLLGVG